MNNSFFYILLTSIMALVSLLIFPLNFIKSNEAADNPNQCPYYVTIQSLLANENLLKFDKANAKLIQQRFVTFENDIIHSPGASAIVASYQKSYASALQKSGIKTAAAMTDLAVLRKFARENFAIVDGYYLNSSIYCTNPLYEWNFAHTKQKFPEHSRRVLQYNLSTLYDHIPKRYSRIMGAAEDEFQLGVYSGFFVNNHTTSFNTQFMTGVPLLTALYVLPNHSFENLGSYQAIVPWNAFNSTFFTSPQMRKLFDITGIDIFTLEKNDIKSGKVVGSIPLVSELPQTFSMSRELQSYVNTQSYGTAYLANNIHYQDPAFVKPYEDKIKGFFAHVPKRAPDAMIAARAVLYKELNNLKEKHDIILETPIQNGIAETDFTTPAGLVDIKGIVGERAFFTTDCKRSNCLFVLNLAKTSGWHVFVNNHSSVIQRANYAFMATEVPAGHATIWFIYQPWSSLFSYFLSIILFIGICLMTSVSPRK